jgi:hypothetical protein
MRKWRDTDQIIAGELYTVEHGLSVRAVVFRVDDILLTSVFYSRTAALQKVRHHTMTMVSALSSQRPLRGNMSLVPYTLISSLTLLTKSEMVLIGVFSTQKLS